MQKTGGCRPISESTKRHLLTPTQLGRDLRGSNVGSILNSVTDPTPETSVVRNNQTLLFLAVVVFCLFCGLGISSDENVQMKMTSFLSSQMADKSCSAT